MENSAANHTMNLMAFLFLIVELVTATQEFLGFCLYSLLVGSMPVDLDPSYKFEPADIPVEKYPIPEAGNDPRRQLAPFQLCLPCKCCSAASPAPVCTSMPCCFGIDCQIPNKPFGFCAFVPKTCNCTSCAV